jgi:integrase/recombinase XerD
MEEAAQDYLSHQEEIQDKQYYRRKKAIIEEFLDKFESKENISRTKIKRYFERKAQNLAKGTVKRHFWTVREFVREDLFYEGKIDQDPFRDLQISNIAPDLKKQEIHREKDEDYILSQEQVEKMCENVPPPALRNELLIKFMFTTGLRRVEVSRAKLENLNIEERSLEVKTAKRKNHDRTVYYPASLDILMKRWLEKRENQHQADHDYLFTSVRGKQLGVKAVSEIVRKASIEAGINEVLYRDEQGNKRYLISSHNLRHSFGQHYLENGGNLKTLSDILGHSDIDTTANEYLHRREEHVKSEMRKNNPL